MTTIYRHLLWLWVSLALVFGWSWVGWIMLTYWVVSVIIIATQEIYHEHS